MPHERGQAVTKLQEQESNIDRSRGPADTFYKPASPTMNGFAKPGSTGNVMADLIRDLKDREAEIEAMKKKESWMKAALLKAERSGFIYAETEEELSSRADDDDIDGRKVTEMVINLKQLKAKIQVRACITRLSIRGYPINLV